MKSPILPPWHAGIHMASTESDFISSDTKESFDKLCQVPEYVEYFRTNGWLEPGAITYKINSYGFRCAEFSSNDCMVALGCSFTMGIGLPLKSTWPQMVGTSIGLEPYTLAWGGNAADTCFRLAEYWLPRLRPKAVFVLTPPPARFELHRADHNPPVEVYLPQTESQSATEIDNYLRHWFTVDENCRLNTTKNQLAIQALCQQLAMPCFVYNVFDWMAKSREEVGWARDRMHAGTIGHQQLANKMIYDWSQK